MTEDASHGPMAAVDDCEHHYETRILGGHPITVSACTFCRQPDWDDLMEQAIGLYRWGWQEGLAGKPARERLSAYDKPREVSDGELAGRDGDSGAQAGTAGAGWTQLEARAFNAVQPALRQAGEWLPLSARRAVANAVLGVVREHLDIGDAEAWCKTCRRVWDGPRHQCETDPEQALARIHHLADLIAAGAPWTSNRDDLAQRIRDAASVDGGQAATGATEAATSPAPDGPSVRECAANDRRWPLEKAGE